MDPEALNGFRRTLACAKQLGETAGEMLLSRAAGMVDYALFVRHISASEFGAYANEIALVRAQMLESRISSVRQFEVKKCAIQ